MYIASYKYHYLLLYPICWNPIMVDKRIMGMRKIIKSHYQKTWSYRLDMLSMIIRWQSDKWYKSLNFMPYPKLTLVITAIPLFFCEKNLILCRKLVPSACWAPLGRFFWLVNMGYIKCFIFKIGWPQHVWFFRDWLVGVIGFPLAIQRGSETKIIFNR